MGGWVEAGVNYLLLKKHCKRSHRVNYVSVTYAAGFPHSEFPTPHFLTVQIRERTVAVVQRTGRGWAVDWRGAGVATASTAAAIVTCVAWVEKRLRRTEDRRVGGGEATPANRRGGTVKQAAEARFFDLWPVRAATGVRCATADALDDDGAATATVLATADGARCQTGNGGCGGWREGQVLVGVRCGGSQGGHDRR